MLKYFILMIAIVSIATALAQKEDTDGDGVKNRFDACPEIQGPKFNNGCPIIPDDTGKIGVYFEIDEQFNYPVITAIGKNLPAYQSGIEKGDYIIKIDSVSVLNMPPEKVVILIAGEPGSILKLNIKRKTAFLDIEVTRTKTNHQEINWIK